MARNKTEIIYPEVIIINGDMPENIPKKPDPAAPKTPNNPEAIHEVIDNNPPPTLFMVEPALSKKPPLEDFEEEGGILDV